MYCTLKKRRWAISFLRYSSLLILTISSYLCYPQTSSRVKVFLMAGQSNMQGYGKAGGVKKLLCAKDEIILPEDPNGCYSSLSTQEERLFETVGDFYGSHHTYDPVKARIVAQSIDKIDMDERLLFPFHKVQVVNFDYRRNGQVRVGPAKWSGPLQVGYGHKNDGETYGPELTFGHYLSQYIQEDIVLVKVAEGGSDLYEKWRSPSMEARLGVSEVTSNYPLLVQHLNEVTADIGHFVPKYSGQDVEAEVAGFCLVPGI